MQTVTLDGPKLQTIVNKNETAKTVMTYLNGRERQRDFVDIGRLYNHLIAQGLKIDRNELMQFCDDLKSIDYATLVIGRRGGAPRLLLHYSMKAIAEAAMTGRQLEVQRLKKAAKGKPRVVKVKKQQEKAPVQKAAQTEAPAVSAGEKLVLIPFRGKALSISLPGDVTKDEVREIGSTLSAMLG
jgi:hypothetical protein